MVVDDGVYGDVVGLVLWCGVGRVCGWFGC